MVLTISVFHGSRIESDALLILVPSQTTQGHHLVESESLLAIRLLDLTIQTLLNALSGNSRWKRILAAEKCRINNFRKDGACT